MKNGSIVLVIALGSSICPDSRNAPAFLRCYSARMANALPRAIAPQKKNGLEAGEGGLAMGGGLAVHRLRALPRARQGQNEHTQHAKNHHLPLGLAQHFFGTCRENMQTPPTTNVAHSMFPRG